MRVTVAQGIRIESVYSIYIHHYSYTADHPYEVAFPHYENDSYQRNCQFFSLIIKYMYIMNVRGVWTIHNEQNM